MARVPPQFHSRHSGAYNFHGVDLVIGCEQPQVLEALHTHLRHFPTGELSDTALRFTFDMVADSTHHVVARPVERLRSVYDPPVGEVVYAAATDQLYISYGEDARVLCDVRQERVQVSYTEAAQDNLWLLTCPLLTIPLMELLKRRQRYSLHAAGVCIDGAGVVMPGTSGAGKTTLTLALLRGGWDMLSDDMLFLTDGGAHAPDDIHALAFPDAIDITEATARFFSELQAWARQPTERGWMKHQLRFEAVYGCRFAWSCEPSVLVFPSVAEEGTSRLIPISQDEALFELAPNVLLTEAVSSQRHLDHLAALARTCQCYRMAVGRDFDVIPDMLRGLL